jgi:Na+/H+ antiporter NhaD/arsenite permease-like protein
MNWYEIFYWVSVADNIKSFFDFTSNLFSWFAVIGFIAYIIIAFIYDDEYRRNSESNNAKSMAMIKKSFGGIFYTSLALALITWFGYMACPSKKDALIIIAGGTVGNFITSDSSAKAIPAEAMILLRTKIKSEIEELSVEKVVVDTLATKSKEELIKMIKEK